MSWQFPKFLENSSRTLPEHFLPPFFGNYKKFPFLSQILGNRKMTNFTNKRQDETKKERKKEKKQGQTDGRTNKREIERHTDRCTYRQTYRQTYIQTEREIERET
jgi:hypothetical protein